MSRDSIGYGVFRAVSRNDKYIISYAKGSVFALPCESLESSENVAMLLKNLSSACSVLQLTTGNSCTRCLIAFSCKCLLRISDNDKRRNVTKWFYRRNEGAEDSRGRVDELYVLCVCMKHWYRSLHSNASGNALKYSFSNVATSCTWSSLFDSVSSNVFPWSKSSRSFRIITAQTQINVYRDERERRPLRISSNRQRTK